MGPSRVVSECPNLLLLRVQSGDTCLGVTGVLINDTDFWACPTPDESAPLDVSLGEPGCLYFLQVPSKVPMPLRGLPFTFVFTGH